VTGCHVAKVRDRLELELRLSLDVFDRGNVGMVVVMLLQTFTMADLCYSEPKLFQCCSSVSLML